MAVDGEASGSNLHALFMEVFALQLALADRMDAIHETAGLHTPQVKVLNALNHLTSATVPDIAASLRVSRQFVQTVCNDLEMAGYMRFSDNPRHKRSRLAALSGTGKQLLAHFREQEAALLKSKLPDLDAEHVMSALALLHDIRTRVESEAVTLPDPASSTTGAK